MISKYKAAIFDMDGTLSDTMGAWRGAFRRYIAENGLDMPEALVGVPEYPAGKATRMIAEMTPGFSMEDANREILRIIDEYYRSPCNRERTGASEIMRRLKEEGLSIVVATATPLKYARHSLRRLGHDRLVDMAVSCDEIGVGKNDVQFFFRLAGLLHVRPEECVMFEDALYSIRTAKAAGLTVCAIEDYYAWRDREEIRATADRYLTCYQDLLDEAWDESFPLGNKVSVK